MYKKLRGSCRRIGALIQKDLKTSRHSFFPMLLLIFLLCAGCAVMCLSVVNSAIPTAQKTVLGIIDKDGSLLSKIAIGSISQNEEVSALFSTRNFTDEQEGYDAVAEGEIVALLIFEQNYFDKIINGDSSAVNVVLSKAMELHAHLIKDFASTGEILIKTGEYGVGAAWHPILDHYGDRDEGIKKYNAFSLQFALEVLSLTGRAAAETYLPYSTNADSLGSHYILLYSTLLITLLDVLFFDYIRRDGSRSMLCRLKSLGVNGIHIFVAKLIPVFLVKTVIFSLLLTALHLTVGLHITLLTLLAALLFLLFSSALGVCFCLLLQRWEVGPCILFAVGFAGLFLSGGLVPYDMLPVSVTDWGAYTPIGVSASILSPLFGGKAGIAPYLLALCYLAVLLTAALGYVARLRTKGSDRV